MGLAKRRDHHGDQELELGDIDDAGVVIDEHTVLQQLEEGLQDEQSDGAIEGVESILGIRNGVLLGAVTWIVILAIYFVATAGL